VERQEAVPYMVGLPERGFARARPDDHLRRLRQDPSTSASSGSVRPDPGDAFRPLRQDTDATRPCHLVLSSNPDKLVGSPPSAHLRDG
jgi:hypothetical protein